MPESVTNAIEVVVGVGCLVAGAGVWRGAKLRWLAIILAIAGLAAVIHGLAALL